MQTDDRQSKQIASGSGGDPDGSGADVLTTMEMEQADRLAIAGGTSGFALMLRAGQAVADAAMDLAEEGPILVVAGRGNNGGDGFVAATELAARGRDVSVILLCERDTLKGDAALAANDPFKVGALVRLASFDAAHGQVEQARAAFEKTGLSADQCALLDARPHLLASNSGSRDFPMEAMQWGFEGWTKLQFDVTADGHTKDVRAIVSYPPFVFTKAGAWVLDGARFSKSYRPDGGIGCGGDTQKVSFRMFAR